MGSASSKFKKYVQNGDEYAAMQVYRGSSELKRSFDPNLGYGESRHHNTAMHYAAGYGMKHLLRTFLTDLGGDPNKRNAFDETVLHSACGAGAALAPADGRVSVGCARLTGAGAPGGGGGDPPEAPAAGALTASAQERRAACVALLLQWRGGRLPASEERERIQLDAVDGEGGSALHLAAAAGLVGGARLLIAAGARALTEDSRGRTAARRALAAGHVRLAALIERAALFTEEPIDWRAERWGWTAAEIAEEEAEEELAAAGGGVGDSHEGLQPRELREAKDRLLVDTSDMLRVSLFAAEALLGDNGWCRDVLVERWMRDAAACCRSAGVSLPGGSLDGETAEEATAAAATGGRETIECGICREEVGAAEAGGGGCGHAFCGACWGRYLRGRVREGEPRPACPAPRCRRPAPAHLLQRCLTPRTQRKCLLFDIEAFVESSRAMKWCPVAGCGRAVRLRETELTVPAVAADGSDGAAYPPVSRGVDCGDFHFFCWECDGEPHPPLGCAAFAEWTARAGAAPRAPASAAADGAESAASSLWLLANCKPCPSCSRPIQKNDGCNHMKCAKCKFDFCWVCLESWKRHGSATGGYFRCTREEAAARAERSRGSALAEARVRNAEARERRRFGVQCARFRRHEQRWRAERPLLVAAPAKAKTLDPANASGGVIEAAARELGLSRRLLVGCCAYAFALPEDAPHRAAFLYAREELERCTERLAGAIAREVIEAPLLCLRRATASARRWRLAASRLARPPPPPAALSAPELRTMARLLARGRLDPRDPWRLPLGPRGEPLRDPDAPEADRPVPRGREPASRAGPGPRASDGSPSRLREPPPTASPRGAPGGTPPADDADVYRIDVSEYSMDLIIALEMSRLQMLEEQGRAGGESDGPSAAADATLARGRQRPARLNISVSIGASDGEDGSLSDDQPKLAIQLSLQEPAGRGGDARGAAGEPAASDAPARSGVPDRDEGWSRAADITMGYLLKALGGGPLELPTFAIPELRRERPRGEPPVGRSIPNCEEDESTRRGDRGAGADSGVSGLTDRRGEGSKARPPLLRSGGIGRRPPLLRQLGGKARRSRSTGDISTRSSGAEDSECGATPDESVQTNGEWSADGRERPCFSTFGTIGTRSSHPDSTRGAEAPPGELRTSEVARARRAADPELPADSGDAPAAPERRGGRDAADRRRIRDFPKNLPWGDFCCERRCAKTNLPDEAPDPAPVGPRERRERRPSRGGAALEAEAGGGDRGGAAEPRGPDADAGRLKSDGRDVGEATGDSFRRHSDHVPRTGDGGRVGVRASSSERHVGRERVGPERPRVRATARDARGSAPESPRRGAEKVEARRALETDSSNECESETGIPKSPTLFISGVSICREPSAGPPAVDPERKSPKARRKSARRDPADEPAALAAGPVVVLATSPSPPPRGERTAAEAPSSPALRASPGFVRRPPTGPATGRLPAEGGLDAPVLPPSHFGDEESSPPTAFDFERASGGEERPAPPEGSPGAGRSARPGVREAGEEPRAASEVESKSASEPEREREMFRFPKSSTDGALSSVLRVQESTLSSDDFHEALFLPERSPKRRRRSRKRDRKEKECGKLGEAGEADSPSTDRDEASSAL